MKQRCILKDPPFSIFINDLNRYFDETCDQVKVGDSLIFCLLYIDDKEILSNSAEGLQKLLDSILFLPEMEPKS